MSRTTRINKPSRLIGSGSYGCVYSPPLLSSQKYEDDELPKVGKIMVDRKEVKDELKEYKKIKDNINTNNKFTPKIYTRINPEINPELTKLNNNVQIDGCHLEKNVNDPYYQIILEDGGVNLYKIHQSFKFQEIVQYFRSIFQGVVKLNAKKFVHQDIKSLNIVFNKNTNKMMLIDFGMSISHNDIFHYNNAFHLSVQYECYPPEYVLYSCQLFTDLTRQDNLINKDIAEAYNDIRYSFHDRKINPYNPTVDDLNSNGVDIFNSIISNLNKFKRKIKAKTNDDVNQKKLQETITKLIDNLNQESRNTSAQRLLDDYGNSVDSNVQEFFNSFCDKIDVYSLGITLITIINDYIDFYSDNYNLLNNNEFLIIKNGLNINTTFISFFKDFMNLVIAMTRPNPRERISSKKSLQTYNKIMKKYMATFQNSNTNTPNSRPMSISRSFPSQSNNNSSGFFTPMSN